MFIKNYKKGFTLIELLIVVVIIGIIAAIVMALLTDARKKGEDSAIETELTSLRSQSAIYANENGNFDNLFTGNSGATWTSGDSRIQGILDSIDDKSSDHTAGSSPSAWALQVRSKENTSEYVCIDSGNNITTSVAQMSNGATVCP